MFTSFFQISAMNALERKSVRNHGDASHMPQPTSSSSGEYDTEIREHFRHLATNLSDTDEDEEDGSLQSGSLPPSVINSTNDESVKSNQSSGYDSCSGESSICASTKHLPIRTPKRRAAAKDNEKTTTMTSKRKRKLENGDASQTSPSIYGSAAKKMMVCTYIVRLYLFVFTTSCT
jgi:hypothetical protein